MIDDPVKATLNVVGALTFYSFLLLPSALKFDFRRDVDRLFILKGLPIPPLNVVLGQLATPVLIASGLQVVVAAATFFVWPSQIRLLASALWLLVPLNVLIYALENLLFVLYPHRLKQEGVEVFLRATLTFSAKGLLFAGAIAAILVWGLCCRTLTRMIGITAWLPGGDHLLFAGGLWVMLAASSAAAILLLAGAYHRLDPSRDLPV